MTIYLMCGLPGAGKSTYVKENFSNIVILSKDDISCELGMYDSSTHGIKRIRTASEEKQISDILNQRLIECCENNLDCVIDDINLTKKHRNWYLEKIKPYNPHIVIIYINTPSDICAERRKGEIPMEVVKALKVIPPTSDEYDELISLNTIVD